MQINVMLRDLKKHYSLQLVPLQVQFVLAKVASATLRKSTTNGKSMEPKRSDLIENAICIIQKTKDLNPLRNNQL